MPPGVLMTPGRLYRVRGLRPHVLGVGSKVWVKEIRDESDRVFVFRFVRDDGAESDFGFDLDDPELLFLTDDDLRQFS